VETFHKLAEGYAQAPNKDAYVFSTYDGNASVAAFRNSAIGTLVIDLTAGTPLEHAIKAFETKVAPESYQRTKAPVTQRQVEQARATLEEAGLTPALDRMVATFDHLPSDVAYFRSRPGIGTVEDDLFGGIATKALSNKASGREISAEEFFSQVLPKAEKVDLFLDNYLAQRMATVVTGKYPDAPRLFKWDNNFSWSYQGDMTDTIIRDRVKSAGGRIDAPVCVRLAWNNYDDLDLSVVEPNGFRIYFGNRAPQMSTFGGQLDVDANGGQSTTRTPVENIFYRDISRMADGIYSVYVHQFRVAEVKDVGFTLEIEINGERTVMQYPRALPDKYKIEVARLTVSKGTVSVQALLESETTTKPIWGVQTNRFVPVTAIFPSPNHWPGERGLGQRHTFVCLEGCKNPEDVRGFYNEFLRPELSQHRRVMELVGSKARAEATTVPQLSGVGLTPGSIPTFKVKTREGKTEMYTVKLTSPMVPNHVAE